MKFSEVARVTIKQDSALYNSMLGCEIINRLTEDPPEQERKKGKKKGKFKALGAKFKRSLMGRNYLKTNN
ncbi:MAG TPA: hypothetical protein PK684_07410 [Bacillota bacterium]|nr:hypothetical protein [Bacillota bacterium]